MLKAARTIRGLVAGRAAAREKVVERRLAARSKEADGTMVDVEGGGVVV